MVVLGFFHVYRHSLETSCIFICSVTSGAGLLYSLTRLARVFPLSMGGGGGGGGLVYINMYMYIMCSKLRTVRSDFGLLQYSWVCMYSTNLIVLFPGPALFGCMKIK